MSEIAILIQAVASLLWPLFAFAVLCVIRPHIADLVMRLKKGKLLGQEIELADSLRLLDASATSVEKEVAALPAPNSATAAPQELVQEENTVKSIVTEAARSPKAALILLAGELEKAAREILATTGHLRGRRFIPIAQAIDELDQKFGLPRHIPSSLKLFWDTRNKLIHGAAGTEEDTVRAIDSGLTILRALQAVPRDTFVVRDRAIQVFGDAGLTEPMDNIHGVLLEIISDGGTSKTHQLLPTTRDHFRVGEPVAWEWDFGHQVGPAWYRSPLTGEIQQAWINSAEFVGRHLDSL